MISRDTTDAIRSQVATIQNEIDAAARDCRLFRAGAVSRDLEVVDLEHRLRSIRAAVMTVFDELDKMDKELLLTPQKLEGST